MNEIIFKSIGTISTDFKNVENVPIQSMGAKGQKGTIELLPEFVPGIKDLEGFSHLILLYHLNQVTHFDLTVTPFMDTVKRGVFATRAPVRPNPIGLTVVKLMSINGNNIVVENVDMLNQTPLLDIKPYLPQIDEVKDVRIGWLTDKIDQFETKKSDARFKSE